jgi:hypothetical protein
MGEVMKKREPISDGENLACGCWLALIVLQVLFFFLWIFNVIDWHWALVFTPLFIFLALPFLSFIISQILEWWWP